MRKKYFLPVIMIAACTLFSTSCKKLLEVAPPINSVTTQEIFSTNKQAEWAIAAIYSKMINGVDYNPIGLTDIADKVYSAGLSTVLGGLSADELTVITDNTSTDFNAQINKLTINNSSKTAEIWKSAYRTIADANAAIDGLDVAKSDRLTESVRKQLTGEALALRAFSYFYLVNFFGDVPLVLSSDYKKTIGLARAPVPKVYEQIKADLIKARSILQDNYSAGNNERVRANKWFAEALLARVYLFTGEYQLAIRSASAVIGHTALFAVEDLNKTFLPNNKDAILQLKPTAEDPVLQNSTPEGYRLYSLPPPGSNYRGYELSSQLVAAFEPNDQRKTQWTFTDGTAYAAAKYITHQYTQYYNVMRVAELHLIRAEATVLLTPAAKNDAIADLNVLRRRAGVVELDNQLTAEQVITAIAHERHVELFLEWGHRWFDLKRTGKAQQVLSPISYKQPWWGNYQFLYPIPPSEIKVNNNLIQNPEYDFR